MKVYFASDHAGFELKSELVSVVKNLGHEAEDLGPYEYDPGDDYPDYIRKAAGAVAADSQTKAIILGGSGQGEAMVANRIAGVRAAIYYGGNMDIVRLGREHNNANILSLGARFVTKEEAEEAVKTFLGTEFSNEERHVRRLAKF